MSKEAGGGSQPGACPGGSSRPRDADDCAWEERCHERCGNLARQGLLGGRQVTPLIKVERIKSWPQLRTKVPASGETGDIRSGRVLSGGPGTEPPQRRALPTDARRRRRLRAARVSVSALRRLGLRIREHCAARVENLGPPGKGTEQTKSALCVWDLPTADNRARALATRRHKRSSHHSVVPIAAPRSLKLADPFQQHPWKSVGVASTDDFSFVEVGLKADPPEACRDS